MVLRQESITTKLVDVYLMVLRGCRNTKCGLVRDCEVGFPNKKLRLEVWNSPESLEEKILWGLVK